MASTTIPFLAIFFLSNLAFLHSAQEEDTYRSGCSPFYCGPTIQFIGFPFFNTTDHKCGGLWEVNCSATEQYIKLGNKSKWYELLVISQANGLEIRDQELDRRFNSQSCDSFQNFTHPYSPSGPISFEILNDFTTFFKCTELTSEADVYFRGYHKYTKCPGYSLYYSYPNNHTGLATVSVPPNCSVIQLPVLPKLKIPKPEDPFNLMTPVLLIGWHWTKEDKSNSKVILATGNKSKWYDLLGISQANTLEIRDQELYRQFNSQSCDSFQNFTRPYSPSSSISFKIINKFTTFFKCTELTSEADVYFRGYHNYTKCPGYSLYYSYPNNHTGLATVSVPPNCSVIQLPLLPKFKKPKPDDPFHLITTELGIGWYWTKEDKSNSKVILATAISGGIVTIICIPLLIIFRRKLGVAKYTQWGKKTESYYKVENFLKINGLVAPKRYCYSDIKKMTRSFKDKLGQGGYGYVYKGKLDNGSLVAVKVLKESKGNGDEFVNEVASISRTSHVNVVTLMGFCFEGRKRALIYEFMPNGSLEKFISNGILSVNSQLGWDKSYRIAIGIARGLEYLHRGCNTRILHFDIKPHNILLDEDFIPKISDFGLAKLCPGKESTVSMLYARGTIGYIAPEVFCRNFGRVSHKSDVYSYGMMVLEIVGGRKNIEVEDHHTSEIYFPDWIYKKLESDKELRMYGMNEDENVYARKMIIVSLWCIQSDPSTRPSMSRVVEMLEGSLESLKIPPKPVLSSPPVSPAHSSTIEIN